MTADYIYRQNRCYIWLKLHEYNSSKCRWMHNDKSNSTAGFVLGHFKVAMTKISEKTI
jgi:hypothetical protein